MYGDSGVILPHILDSLTESKPAKYFEGPGTLKATTNYCSTELSGQSLACAGM